MIDRWLARLRSTFRLLYDAVQSWIDDRAIRLGAGVAYYSLFALIPVLFLAISFASIFLDREAVNEEVERALSDLLGPETAEAISRAVEEMMAGSPDALLPLLGFGALLFTATLLFVAWKEVVDILWGLPRQRGMKASIRRRLFGLAAVLGSGVLLTLTLFSQTFVAALDGLVPIDALDRLIEITGSVLPSILGAIFVAILFKYTPDVDVEWRSVWLAAVTSMVLLVVGAWGYGIYLERFGFASAAGVAGSLFLGLAFVYYAMMILMYGMEIVKEKYALAGSSAENSDEQSAGVAD